ncbi:MAG: M20/M25/M40 family metallo-hydrolase [Candidatus Heimdallarchaeota archaeon]|nr:M20/M25/M40 family metallo-hydrolase [Candidatus Heimdallarchaeota archaeon]
MDDIIRTLQPYFDEIDQMKEYYINDTIEITKIAAPPFNEWARGKYIQSRFEKLGYITKIDKIGNVIAYMDESKIQFPNEPGVMIAAHLDTVFDENVNIAIRREGDIIHGPGIGDDGRGLTNLLALASYCIKHQVKRPIYFIADVGEEGLGDLRGMKYLFSDAENKFIFPISAFITIDGTGNTKIVNQSIGSKRYRIHFKADGGHSYGAFGIVNPGFALANFLNEMGKLTVPDHPKTTYSVGVIQGGTSVNSIPFHVSADIDMRSEDVDELNTLETKVKGLAFDACEHEENLRQGKISLEFEKIGDRPAGKTEAESDLVKLMIKVNSHFKLDSQLVASSTDANIPHQLGIPALSVSGVDISAKAHSLQEWIDAGSSSLLTIKRNLLLMAMLVF